MLLSSCGMGAEDTPKSPITELSSSSAESCYEPSPETEKATKECTTEESAPPVEPSDEKIRKILSEMTLGEKIGQLFLARNPKTKKEGLELIEEKSIGGIIFFARDFKGSTPEDFKALIESYSASSHIPLLTSVDEEGGDVCRVSNYVSFRNEKFKSPAELYSEGGIERIISDCDEKSKFLLSLGLNFNLAPVVDISVDENDFIYHRALGQDRDKTAEYAVSLVEKMNENGILSAIKHFPGYGNNEDTHTGIAYDSRSLDALRENDLVPFREAIREGAPAVMISHNVIIALDPKYPASLSSAAYKLLREELGCEGVIMTDDLSMGAVSDFTDSGEAAVLAVEAGADLLCCSDIEDQYSALLEAVESGRISIERIEDSVLRLLSMKLKFGIIKPNS